MLRSGDGDGITPEEARAAEPGAATARLEGRTGGKCGGVVTTVK